MASISIDNSVDSVEALIQACVTLGVDGEVSYRPHSKDGKGVELPAQCLITGTSSSQEQFQAAIDEAQIGALTYNKVQRIDEVYNRSTELFEAGFTFTRPSDSEVSPVIPNDDTAEIQLGRIGRATDGGAAAYPQYLSTSDGRGFALNSAADLAAAILGQDTQGVYILGAQVNGDGSMGEAMLNGLIGSAIDQATLDSIVDTRT
ncbi:hypothetical protein NVP1210O_34 [Vibrio phage 1.210.O._10N.222.52.C2]|nr:hypothetical protein NVP1210O_34 [Vibrio phage 1.210.O._10N.222.52.C2]